MKPSIKCKAILELLPPDAGGRSRAIHSGYRGRFKPDIDDERMQDDYHADTELLGPPLAPGTAGPVLICFGLNGVVPDVWPGLGFSLREGPHVVARGRVTELMGHEDDQ
jgi:hypothetical protein